MAEPDFAPEALYVPGQVRAQDQEQGKPERFGGKFSGPWTDAFQGSKQKEGK